MHYRRAPTGYQVNAAMSVAEAVRASVIADNPEVADDQRLLADLIDGETEALDIVRALIRYSLEAQMMADALSARLADLRTRKDRFERQLAMARNTAAAMLEALEWREPVVEPDFTATLGRGRVSVLITDVNALPDRLVRIKREPDKTAIGVELKDGEIVPGAELSNGGSVLAVRTR